MTEPSVFTFSTLAEPLTSAVVLSVLVFTFLAVFFYTYVTRVEQEVFDASLVNVFDRLDVDPNVTRVVLDTIPTDQPLDEGATLGWQRRNKVIETDTWVTVSLCLLTAFLFSFGMSLFLPSMIVWKQVWLRALFFLVFIALTEWMFLNLVTRAYETVSAVEVKRIISKKIDENRQDK